MNEWKDLKKDKLPEDILTEGYRIQYLDCQGAWRDSMNHIVRVLDKVYENICKYRYRKPEPKAPSHEEIMTLWWKRSNGVWFKVQSYDPRDRTYLYSFILSDEGKTRWKDVEYFTDLESSILPPEGPRE